jgi:hypothetical protein
MRSRRADKFVQQAIELTKQVLKDSSLKDEVGIHFLDFLDFSSGLTSETEEGGELKDLPSLETDGIFDPPRQLSNGNSQWIAQWISKIQGHFDVLRPPELEIDSSKDSSVKGKIKNSFSRLQKRMRKKTE